MQSAVFFPHFYIPSETFIRHQMLYTPNLKRMQASDRLPQDSKSVKKLIKALISDELFEPIIPQERDDRVARKVQFVLKKAFEAEEELYIKHLGKYGKERTSTKTFHMCRVKVWEDLVKFLIKMDLATLDSIAAGSHVDFDKLREIQENIDHIELKAEWCFSTRTVIQTFCTALTIEYQKEHQIPRTTDHPQYDRLAALIEGEPVFDGTDKMINRAVFEFSYPIPQDIEEIEYEKLKELREQLLPITLPFVECIENGAKSLEVAPGQKEADPIMQNIQTDCRKHQQKLRQVIQNAGFKAKTNYGQIRWYPAKGSGLDSAILPSPHCTGILGLKVESLPVAKSMKETIRNTPECWVWSMEQPVMEQTSGVFRAIRKWFG